MRARTHPGPGSRCAGSWPAIVASVLALTSCSTPRQPTEALPAPVVRVPVPSAPQAGGPALAAPGEAGQRPGVAMSSRNALGLQPFPPNILYMCVLGSGSAVRQTAIEFVPKVLELCRKHPEMGPCQYERQSCRHGGGRVFAADGTEITSATEAQYDKRVYRVRFRGD